MLCCWATIAMIIQALYTYAMRYPRRLFYFLRPRPYDARKDVKGGGRVSKRPQKAETPPKAFNAGVLFGLLIGLNLRTLFSEALQGRPRLGFRNVGCLASDVYGLRSLREHHRDVRGCSLEPAPGQPFRIDRKLKRPCTAVLFLLRLTRTSTGSCWRLEYTTF